MSHAPVDMAVLNLKPEMKRHMIVAQAVIYDDTEMTSFLKIGRGGSDRCFSADPTETSGFMPTKPTPSFGRIMADI